MNQYDSVPHILALLYTDVPVTVASDASRWMACCNANNSAKYIRLSPLINHHSFCVSSANMAAIGLACSCVI